MFIVELIIIAAYARGWMLEEDTRGEDPGPTRPNLRFTCWAMINRISTEHQPGSRTPTTRVANADNLHGIEATSTVPGCQICSHLHRLVDKTSLIGSGSSCAVWRVNDVGFGVIDLI